MAKRSTDSVSKGSVGRPKIVLVAGGSASGKTAIVSEAARMLRVPVLVISQDAYYRDRSHLTLAERDRLNFDEPGAFEWPLLLKHLRELRRGRPVLVPTYSYKAHTRLKRGRVVQPATIIIVEGLFPYWDRTVRRVADLRVFVALDPDLRLIRRLERDVRERSRSVVSVIQQYLGTVRPMHQRNVGPCRRYADLVVSGENSKAAARQLVRALRKLVLCC